VATTEKQATVEELLAALNQALARGEVVTRRPGSTYRLQLHKGFDFDAAARAIPYLHALGVSDIYLSPILAAAPGSMHGYDVVAYDRVNPELGGEDAFRRLAFECTSRGMGVVLDFVPNHMGIGAANAWWMDVLENGPSSMYASAFDVDWTPLKRELGHRVLVPVLGDQFGRVLERGELKLAREGGTLVIRYHDHTFPVNPRSVPMVLRHRLRELAERLGPTDAGVQDLESICTALEKLAPRTETSPAAMQERAREKEVAKRRLATLFEQNPAMRAHVDENIAIFDGTPGDPRSFDLLQKLLDAQAYRLAFWRVAGEEINYRRFFDVNGLAAIRMEEPAVFAQAHRIVLGLLREGLATGLRIDHPDGLYVPFAYFRRLQASFLLERCRALAAQGGGALDPAIEPALLDRLFEELELSRLPRRPLYVVVEKVLVGAEPLPEDWDVDGTTGYELLATLDGLFVDPSAERAFEALFQRVAGGREDWREVVAEKKRVVMSAAMASEVNMLAHRLAGIAETDRRTRDFTQNELTRALVEYVALFPVYRTYVSRRGEVDDRTRAVVEATMARARRRSPLVDPSIYDFLRDVILQRYPEGLSELDRQAWVEFALRLQQVTGPVHAKAAEDTAFYTYVRLASLNEVGGEPDRFGTPPADVHGLLARRRTRMAASLSPGTTHDTKRSEDVRLRISALTEIPGDWRSAVARWARAHRAHVRRSGGRAAPDPRDEYFVYQTLAGAWPDEGLAPGTPAHADFLARMIAYFQKAIREAKRHTSWTNPDEEYEKAVKAFLERNLTSPQFLEQMGALAGRLARAGRVSSLAQLAIRLFAPGVPDVYQGTELWDLSLVDPDNRRPVDWDRRRQALEALEGELASGRERAAIARALADPAALPDGRAKLFLLRAGLEVRGTDRELLLEGDYAPLAATGRDADHVFAFARVRGGRAAVCAAPRLVLQSLERNAGVLRLDGVLPLPGLPRRWRDAVTGACHAGEAIPLAALYADFPVALLVSE
jgi:(1->4)-alpha-D-glucan 1-alpha-D-glucosylmutase